MKNLIITFFSILLLIVTSCQSPEEKAISIVENFYNDMYQNGATKYNGSLKRSREALNYDYFSTEMENLIRNNFIGIPEQGNYKLTSENKKDRIIVTSIGKSPGLFGNMVEHRQEFSISKIDEAWKITDTYALIGLNVNFQVEDTQWETYWDIKKARILNEVKDSLKLEVIKKGYKSYYGDAMKGELRLVNNSDYDVKFVEILIEHYDKDGISVNTDNEYLNDVIRSKGYREFDWYTSDCSKCKTQTFKIKYVKETIK